MARDAGAKNVIVASCAPPIRYVRFFQVRDHVAGLTAISRHSNVYGIDMPSPTELVAHGRTTAEIAQAIGADRVIFQKLENLIHSVQQFNPSIPTFDCSVFTGEYITGGVDAAYLSNLSAVRNDNAKRKQVEAGVVEGVAAAPSGGCAGPMNGADETIGLYNSWKGTTEKELAVRGVVS